MATTYPTERLALAIGQTDAKVSTSGKDWLAVRTVDGTRYSCWDKKLFSRLASGRVVYCEVQINGEHRNIVGIAEEAPIRASPYVTAGEPINSASEANARTRDIHRQTALKCAVEAYGLFSGEPHSQLNYVRHVGHLAEYFVQWIETGNIEDTEEMPF